MGDQKVTGGSKELASRIVTCPGCKRVMPIARGAAVVCVCGVRTDVIPAPVPRIVRVLLGREAMGPHADQSDFRSWVDYVAERRAGVERAHGIGIIVGTRRQGDAMQTNDISGTDDESVESVRGLLADWWDEWCENGNPGHVRNPAAAQRIVAASMAARDRAKLDAPAEDPADRFVYAAIAQLEGLDALPRERQVAVLRSIIGEVGAKLHELLPALKVGARVRLRRAIERNDFTIAAGATGVVTYSEDDAVGVKLDAHVAALDEWENEAVWLDADETLPDLWKDLEVVADVVEAGAPIAGAGCT